MIYPLAALVASLIVWTAVTRGTGKALARGWALAMLGPCWISAEFASTEIDLRIVAVVSALGCVAIAGDWRRTSWLCWSDVAAALLIVAQVGSEYKNESLGFKAVFVVVTQWGLPYVLGRMMFRSPAEARRLQPTICVLCLVFSLWTIGESVLRVNPVNRLLGHRGSEQSETEVRWGLRRAEGPTSHPIFCGMALAAIFPWSLYAARLARGQQGRRWWSALPWLNGAAVVCTMSRGPQLTLILTLAAVGFFRCPRYRTVLIVGMCVLACTAYVGQEALLNYLQAWSKEPARSLGRVTINGQEFEYSGTRHRLLQMLVFEDAMINAGLLGYGVNVLSANPLRVPCVDPHLLFSPFNSIDNHYIYFTLLSGFLGIGSFVALGLISLVRIWPQACDLDNVDSWLAAGLFGVQLAMMLTLTTVWFSDDFGFQWLFNCAYIASWQAFNRPKHGQAISPQLISGNRRLVPGHPAGHSGGSEPLGQLITT